MKNIEIKVHNSLEKIQMFLFPFIEPLNSPKIIYSSDKLITQSSEGIRRKLMEYITRKYRKCPKDADHNKMYNNVLNNICRSQIKIV